MPPRRPITLLSEILEQPSVLKSVLKKGLDQTAPETSSASNPPFFPKASLPKPSIQRLQALAEGSSKHALEIAQPFIEAWTGLTLEIFDPQALEQRLSIAQTVTSEALPTLHGLFDNTFIMVVSQSGETKSVIQILDRLKGLLKKPLAGTLFTNQPEATLASMLSGVISVGSGREQSIAATKTLTATVLCLLLWALQVASSRKTIDPKAIEQLQDQLSQLPKTLKAFEQDTLQSAVQGFGQALIKVNHFILLSAGALTLILPEAGLKLIETSSNIVYTDNSESFKHGPKVMLLGVREVHPNTVYIVPPEPAAAEQLYSDMLTHFTDKAGELAYKSNRVFMVRYENSPPLPVEIQQALKINESRILTLPAANTLFDTLFMGLMTFQMVSYFVAEAKGEDPDNPNLSKAVTT